MLHHPIRTLIVACIATLLFVSASANAAEFWQAGAAKINITPTKPMWMSGYGGRDHAAEGTLTELWAKALVLQDPRGERVVIVSLDLVGIDRVLSMAVCDELKKRHGLERRQVAFFCSHTHTGPVVDGNLVGMWTFDEANLKLVREYTVELRRNMIDVVGDAIAKLAPARVEWDIGLATFAVNRRTNDQPNVPKLRAAGVLKGPFDHDVPVLSVRDPESGAIRAVAFGYACHSTVLPFYQWSGDYPGFAMIELEKAHPDAVALFWAGCGADQNPLPRTSVELAQHYGRTLATAVDAIIARPMKPVEGSVSSFYSDVPVDFDKLPTREQIEANAKSANKFEVARAKTLLAKLDAGQALEPTYQYPVQLWRLGPDLKWITLGGEVVVDYSLRLKRELGPNTTWVAGYTNDVMAYIPSLRVLKEGGYEGGGSMVYYGLPSFWSPDVEDTIVKGVHSLILQSQPKP